ncbi:MAG: hypothetical protein HQL33_03705 [Alphaproteobacteria bacterium]|nr:hypothetical protein [Alphaproteobacteria bacterium]MBF0129077.1 hypothetical protein [Alphaproteobacteria bacterium]
MQQQRANDEELGRKQVEETMRQATPPSPQEPDELSIEQAAAETRRQQEFKEDKHNITISRYTSVIIPLAVAIIVSIDGNGIDTFIACAPSVLASYVLSERSKSVKEKYIMQCSVIIGYYFMNPFELYIPTLQFGEIVGRIAFSILWPLILLMFLVKWAFVT